MSSMHDAIFIVGFADIVRRDAAADPHVGSPGLLCLRSRYTMSKRRLQAREFDGINGISSKREAIAARKEILPLSSPHDFLSIK
jgi:hypothetical protein